MTELLPSEAHGDPGSPRRAVSSPAARRWYAGASLSLVWLFSAARAIVEASPTAGQAALGILLVVLYGALFLIGAPLSWALPGRARLLCAGGLLAFSVTMFPWLSGDVTGLWVYVGVLVGMSVVSWRVTFAVILGLGVAAPLLAAAVYGWSEGIFTMSVIIVSISLMMATFGRNVAAMNQLRATQRQLEELAIERERGRVARDIHDILGHSLTVITVKSELAGRLIEANPARARIEIGEVESVARGALADVRATVAGLRAVTVSGELAAARAALETAGITAALPGSTEAVPPQHRELAGWVIREGVTNVIRHSGAANCRILLSPDTIEISDDGAGPTAGSTHSTGLSGLRERVEAAGGQLAIGRSDLGGFRLEVAL